MLDMALSVQFVPLHEVSADWLIVPIFEEEIFAAGPAALDNQLAGLLARLREAGDITGKPNELKPLFHCPGVAAQRLLMIGLGSRAKADRFTLLDAATAAARFVTDQPRRQVALAVPENIEGLTAADIARACGVGLLRGCQDAG